MDRSWLGAMALLLSVAALTTSGRADPLHNIRAVKLTMPDVGEAGTECGLSRERLELAFFEPLAERGLEAVDSGTGYRLFLRATTIAYLEQACVSYVEAQLLLTTRYQDAANQQERSGHVQLWSDGGLHVSDRREHGDTVERAMRRLGGNLAARWDAAN